MSPEETAALRKLLKLILIEGQRANPNAIDRNRALRALTEKIDISIPVDAFFHIGINAMVDHENTENEWLEKVFSFYS